MKTASLANEDVNSVKTLTKNSGFFNRRLVIFTGNLTFLPILTWFLKCLERKKWWRKDKVCTIRKNLDSLKFWKQDLLSGAHQKARFQPGVWPAWWQKIFFCHSSPIERHEIYGTIYIFSHEVFLKYVGLVFFSQRFEKGSHFRKRVPSYKNNRYSPLEFNSRKIRRHLTNWRHWTRWNICDKVWISATSLFK